MTFDHHHPPELEIVVELGNLVPRKNLFSQKVFLWLVGGLWWSKGILEFRFDPNLGLRLEAETKLNKSGVPDIFVTA